MQQPIDFTPERMSTPEIVVQAKSHFERFSERLLHLFSFVPDEKLTWTPSPTSRSSLRIVAHCALTSQFFADVITGNMPERNLSPEEFFNDLHQEELRVTTRESAVTLVKETTANLCKAIDTVNAENLNFTPNSPFGALTLRFWISQGGEQLAGHVGQLEYLQTIWGDLDNHLG